MPAALLLEAISEEIVDDVAGHLVARAEVRERVTQMLRQIGGHLPYPLTSPEDRWGMSDEAIADQARLMALADRAADA